MSVKGNSVIRKIHRSSKSCDTVNIFYHFLMIFFLFIIPPTLYLCAIDWSALVQLLKRSSCIKLTTYNKSRSFLNGDEDKSVGKFSQFTSKMLLAWGQLRETFLEIWASRKYIIYISLWKGKTCLKMHKNKMN